MKYYIKFDLGGNVIKRDIFPIEGGMEISKELFNKSVKEMDGIWKLVDGQFVKTPHPVAIEPPFDADRVRAHRAMAYRAESDPLKIEADYDAFVNNTEPDYTAWILKVVEIKQRYPLPD